MGNALWQKCVIIEMCYRQMDAGSGKPFPTQTGQRSGELIVKGGMQAILCKMRYIVGSEKPSRASLPMRWISPPLNPSLNNLLKGMAYPNQLTLAARVHRIENPL